MKNHAVLLFAIVAAAVTGCSSEAPEQSEDQRHVWSEQTDTLDRAREVEQTLQQGAARQRQALEAMED